MEDIEYAICVVPEFKAESVRPGSREDFPWVMQGEGEA